MESLDTFILGSPLRQIIIICLHCKASILIPLLIGKLTPKKNTKFTFGNTLRELKNTKV